ncbi:MAG: PTS glucose transporter subunit IIA [Clostridium sp.]
MSYTVKERIKGNDSCRVRCIRWSRRSGKGAIWDFYLEKEIGFVSPAGGTLMDITAVADPAFSSKMMGDGFAIELTEGEVVAPFDAEVTAAFPTGHAYGLRRKDGVECLIHIGMDTVKLNGEALT